MVLARHDRHGGDNLFNKFNEMKKNIVIALVTLSTSVQSQSLLSNDCPIMKISDSIDYTEWQSSNNIKPSKNPIWFNGEPYAPITHMTPAIYCPCGCNFPYVRIQRRIDKNSGAEQQRQLTQYWIVAYVPPKTEYQRIKDSINSKH